MTRFSRHRARRLFGAVLVLIGLHVALIASARAEKTAEDFIIHPKPLPPAELIFVDGDGTQMGLDAFRGKYVLLNIWATWRSPCRREMPTLDRLQSILGGPDFEVAALSIDRAGVKVVRKFYDDIGIRNLAIYVDSASAALRALEVIGLPTTFLIDPAGRQLAVLVGPADWSSPEMIAFLRRQMGPANDTSIPNITRGN